MGMPLLPSVLEWPVRKVWVSADYDDHGYKALDLGWWDYDASMPEDTGRNPRLYAMADGIVVQIVNSHPDDPDWNGYGNYIVIEYPSIGMWSLFAHIKKDSFFVSVGDTVRQGDPVARMGNSGYSYGNHLHLEVGYGHFVRHGGVDYLPLVYATPWHVIDTETQRDYNIRHMVLSPVDKDIAQNQVHVFGDDLRVRKAPINGETVGYAVQGYYSYTDIVEDEHIWCRVGDYWIAADTDVSELLRASFVPVDKDESVNQAEVTIDDLRIRKEPSTKAEILGYAPVGFYNVDETESDDELVWLKTNGAWIAFVDGVIYHGKKEDKDKEIEELKEQVEHLQEENLKLENEVSVLDNKCSALTDVVKGIKEICETVLTEV